LKRLLLGFCLLFLSSFLDAKPLYTEYKTKVIEANEHSAIIADSPEFVLGASGVIIHRFDAKTASIITRVDVVNKANGKAVLKFEKFNMLAQGAFPDTGVKPAIGDDVIINYLYDRALIIAPNQGVYTDITKKYNEMTWIHPDIIAGYLTKLYRPNPDKAIFQEACYQNSASIIFFAVENKGHFVDCHNFNILQSIDIKNSGEIELPFYTRVKNIESTWFSWNSSTIADYNNYYAYILGQAKTLKGSGMDGIILNLPFEIVEKKETLWK